MLAPGAGCPVPSVECRLLDASAVSQVILDNSAHCGGGADTELNVCATPPGVPYARGSAHVAPLVLVKTIPFRLRIFASFCARRAVFAPFSLQFGFVSGPFSVRFWFVFQRSSFVFKYLLASFPLFFIFCGSRLSPFAGATRRSFAPVGRGPHFATNCPWPDHFTRLSPLCGIVKREGKKWASSGPI
jgi:hypothetical protein